MDKHGNVHDYDLMANQEESAKGQTCDVCGDSPMQFQWSDYNGEGMCVRCGCPYQLINGTHEQKEEGDYPYLSLKDLWIPIVREYYEQTGRFTYLGMKLGLAPGMKEFSEWVEENHPEMIQPTEADDEQEPTDDGE